MCGNGLQENERFMAQERSSDRDEGAGQGRLPQNPYPLHACDGTIADRRQLSPIALRRLLLQASSSLRVRGTSGCLVIEILRVVRLGEEKPALQQQSRVLRTEGEQEKADGTVGQAKRKQHYG